MAMAMLASVTVSMAEATIGILRRILGVMRVRISTSDGRTSDSPGFNSTSSKVYASRGRSLEVAAIANSAWPARQASASGERLAGERKEVPRPIRWAAFGPAFGLAAVDST